MTPYFRFQENRCPYDLSIENMPRPVEGLGDSAFASPICVNAKSRSPRFRALLYQQKEDDYQYTDGDHNKYWMAGD